MSAVIDRLVLRALPQPGGVRPRLPTRFETGPASVEREVALQVDGPPSDLGSKPREISLPGSSNLLEPAAPLVHPEAGQKPRAPTRPEAPARAASHPVMPAVTSIGALAAPAPSAPQPAGASDAIATSHAAPEPGDHTAVEHLLPAREHRPALSAAPLLRAPAAVDDEQQAPEVHISIGRIELRTSTPPQPPQRTRPCPSLMSLEDYLASGRRGP